ncbi:putative quinol monooxygenase [Roseomonas sp. WA12]
MQEAETPNAVGALYGAVSAGAFCAVAQIRAKPGKEEALRAETLPLIEQVRLDPKNLVYFLQEDRDYPGHFVFYEIFATEEDFMAHNEKPYVKEWFAKLKDLAQGNVEVLRLKVLPAED